MIGFVISLLYSFPVIFLLNGNGSIIWLLKRVLFKTFIYFRRVIYGIMHKKVFTIRKLCSCFYPGYHYAASFWWNIPIYMPSNCSLVANILVRVRYCDWSKVASSGRSPRGLTFYVSSIGLSAEYSTSYFIPITFWTWKLHPQHPNWNKRDRHCGCSLSNFYDCINQKFLLFNWRQYFLAINYPMQKDAIELELA
jgi:hypothetical protein